MVKKKLNKRAVVLGCLALYIIGLLGTSYFELLRPLENIQPVWKFLKLYNIAFATTRNGLFFGTVFVGMGALFAYKKIHMKQSTAITGFVISMLLMFGEAYIVGYFNLARDNDMYVSLIPAIFFLFYIATHIDAEETTVTIALRKYSSFIYFIHLWIDFGVSIIENIVELLWGTEIYINSLLRYVLVAVGSLIASMIFYKVQDFKKLRWLKNLV
ncbi:MAG: hypothetical protein LUH55_09490 [Bacteroides thetaiotaomicron]|nr:hypothetical protein [Bacteroides thetaiotaomicron]